jgi:antitoxin ParD1/3/4
MPRKPNPKNESQEIEMRLAALDAAIERGLADAEAGHVKPLAAVFDRLEARYRSPLRQANNRSQ